MAALLCPFTSSVGAHGNERFVWHRFGMKLDGDITRSRYNITSWEHPRGHPHVRTHTGA